MGLVMKVVVLMRALTAELRELLERTAAEVGAEVCFAESEAAIPEGFRDAEVVYGFGVETARKSMALRWLSVPSAGVSLMTQSL